MLHCPPDSAAVHDGARGLARLETPHRRQSWSAPRRAPVIHRPLLQALLPHTHTHLTRPPLLLQLSHLFSSLSPQPRPKHSQHTMVSSLMSLSSCEAKEKLTCRCSSQFRVKLCPSQVRLRGHASPGAAGDPCWQSSARRSWQAERTATDEPCLFPAPRRSRPLLAARRARLRLGPRPSLLVVEKHSGKGASKRFAYAYSEMQGWRICASLYPHPTGNDSAAGPDYGARVGCWDPREDKGRTRTARVVTYQPRGGQVVRPRTSEADCQASHSALACSSLPNGVVPSQQLETCPTGPRSLSACRLRGSGSLSWSRDPPTHPHPLLRAIARGQSADLPRLSAAAMEDAHATILSLPPRDSAEEPSKEKVESEPLPEQSAVEGENGATQPAFFAVYDGHGGASSSFSACLPAVNLKRMSLGFI
jgi:hypothetical protein